MSSTGNRRRRSLGLGEAGAAARTSRWLARRRPRPRSAFVDELRGQLAERVAALGRPRHLGVWVAGCIGAGVVLLVLAAVIAAS